MYWWRFAVVQYLGKVLGYKVEDVEAFDRMLEHQSKRPWNIHINGSLQNGTFFDTPRVISGALRLPKTVLSA
jgi:hypothetical protein